MSKCRGNKIKKKSMTDVTNVEILMLIVLVLFLIFFVPTIGKGIERAKNLPDEEARNEFKSLVTDIEGVLPEQSFTYTPKYFAEFKLVATKECIEKEKPETDKCLNSGARLCLKHINDEKRPICEDLDNVNFAKTHEYPLGKDSRITITKDKSKNRIVDIVVIVIS